jgi:hypothetical protein
MLYNIMCSGRELFLIVTSIFNHALMNLTIIKLMRTSKLAWGLPLSQAELG